MKNFWWENQSRGENGLGWGVPQAKREQIFLLWQVQETGTRRPRRGKRPRKHWVLYVNSMPLLRKSVFFSIRCNEHVSSSSSRSKIRGVQARVKWHVGGAWQWKFGGEHTVWAEGKKHMWNIPERKCHRKKLWGSILQSQPEPQQKCCALVHDKKKKNPTNKQAEDCKCPTSHWWETIPVWTGLTFLEFSHIVLAKRRFQFKC